MIGATRPVIQELMVDGNITMDITMELDNKMRLIDRIDSFLNTIQNRVVLVVCKNDIAVKQTVDVVRDNIEEKLTASYTKISNEKGAVVFFLTQSSTGCALRGTSLDDIWFDDGVYPNRDLMLAILPCIKIGG